MNNKSDTTSFTKEKYDFIFSMGEACFCSTALRETCRQFRSMPFDWVGNATIAERAQMIANGFEDWLKPELMEFIGEQTIELKHKFVYRNTKTDICFIHDFLQADNFETSFAKVKEKYDRRIARLYKSIQASRRVLAVYMGNPKSKVKVTDTDLRAAKEALDKAANGVAIDLLYLCNNDDTPYSRRKTTVIQPGVYKVEFCYNSFDDSIVPIVLQRIRKFCRQIRFSCKLLTWRDILERYRIFYIKKSKYKAHRIVKVFRIPVWRYTP